MNRDVRRRAWSSAKAGFAFLLLLASVGIPASLLSRADMSQLEKWYYIGGALAPVGFVLSGLALFYVAGTLRLQQQESRAQRLQDARSSEIELRHIHMSLVAMSLQSPELREVWPPLGSSHAESSQDLYCNLVINLQKLAYEAGTIDLEELRGALDNLFTSASIYNFWARSRLVRPQITGAAEDEQTFFSIADAAFARASRPSPPAVRVESWPRWLARLVRQRS